MASTLLQSTMARLTNKRKTQSTSLYSICMQDITVVKAEVELSSLVAFPFKPHSRAALKISRFSNSQAFHRATTPPSHLNIHVFIKTAHHKPQSDTALPSPHLSELTHHIWKAFTA